MIVNHRRARVLSVVQLPSAIAVDVLVAVPFTKHYVQNVDDAVRRAAVSVQTRPTTLIAERVSLLGGTWVNWSMRVVRWSYSPYAASSCNWPPSAWRWCHREALLRDRVGTR